MSFDPTAVEVPFVQDIKTLESKSRDHLLEKYGDCFEKYKERWYSAQKRKTRRLKFKAIDLVAKSSFFSVTPLLVVILQAIGLNLERTMSLGVAAASPLAVSFAQVLARLQSQGLQDDARQLVNWEPALREMIATYNRAASRRTGDRLPTPQEISRCNKLWSEANQISGGR